ncbi:MAG: hypothetical protein AAF799_27145 [Myxococcota bacterium]
MSNLDSLLRSFPPAGPLARVVLAASVSVLASCNGSTSSSENGGGETGSVTSETGADVTGSETGADTEVVASDHILASVVITDVGRTTYLQVTNELSGHLGNETGIEIAGQAEFFVEGRNLYVGLSEEPTWVKYEIGEDLQITEVSRMSLATFGLPNIDFGNAIVDADTAVSISSQALLAIVWNPQTMEITGTVDLGHMADPDLDLENWTTTAHDGLVYIPARWGSVLAASVAPRVHLTVVDPDALEVVAIAEDERCSSGGRIVFDEAGYGYVMGDGRNYGAQLAAQLAGDPVPENCLLRIPPGGTDFEEGYFHTIKSLTGGVESITELETNANGGGYGFAKMFHPDQLPDGVDAVDFSLWGYNAHRLWRIQLGDEPSAEPVEGAPYSIVGFAGSEVDGQLYVGESEDAGASSTVYAVDAEANLATPVFTMDGYFHGLFRLES